MLQGHLLVMIAALAGAARKLDKSSESTPESVDATLAADPYQEEQRQFQEQQRQYLERVGQPALVDAPSKPSVQKSGEELATITDVAVVDAEEPATTIGGILIPIATELAGKIAQELADYSIDWVKELASASSTQVSQPDIGAVWVTQVNGTWATFSGNVISAYYHPSKTHSATSKGKLGEKRSIAAAGEWAVSAQTRALFGNQAYYSHW